MRWVRQVIMTGTRTAVSVPRPQRRGQALLCNIWLRIKQDQRPIEMLGALNRIRVEA